MANKSQSRIFNKAKKAGARQWKQSRGKEANVAGGQQLPGGIVGGVALLVNKEWRETERDKTPFLMLQFAVAEPEEHEGVKQTLTYFFADSKYRSIQDTTDRLSSDIQLMGTDTGDMGLEELDEVLDELVEQQAAIKFNTRAGKTDDGKAWFKFDVAGVAEDFEPADEDEPEPDEDDSDEDYEEDDSDGEYEDEEDESDDADYEEDESEDGDEEDYEEEDYEEESKDEEDESDEGEWSPERGEVYGFKPKGAKRSYECEITTVNNTKETVTLKRLSDGKRFSNVPWDKLEGGE